MPLAATPSMSARSSTWSPAGLVWTTQDIDTVTQTGIDGLIQSLSRWRGGDLRIDPQDFDGSTLGSRFYPLLYLLTRVRGARDLGTGLEIKASLLGRLSSLQVHHIFPKVWLYEAGYTRSEVNAVANFCLLTQDSNLVIGKRDPAEYLAAWETRQPGALASQWIPTDPQLWRRDRYLDVLAARRELLAAAANDFLDELRRGEAGTVETPLPRAVTVVEDEEPDDRDREVGSMIERLRAVGYAVPQRDVEIPDPETGAVLSVAEPVWPDGLQPGLGAPVVLELDPGEMNRSRLEELGYEIFTSVDALTGYATRRAEREAAAQA